MEIFDRNPLEPCPICRQPVEYRTFNHYHQGVAIKTVHLILCPECGIEMSIKTDPREDNYPLIVQALLRRWNTRTGENR